MSRIKTNVTNDWGGNPGTAFSLYLYPFAGSQHGPIDHQRSHFYTGHARTQYANSFSTEYINIRAEYAHAGAQHANTKQHPTNQPGRHP